MVTVTSYGIALACCIYCCICWGSWANTQKLVAQKNWSTELFYWDFVVGVFITALIGALTLGCLGTGGHTFFDDLAGNCTESGCFDWASAGNAMLGGIVWNFANIFLTLAIAVAGMSVGFPIGGGLGWLGGIVFAYLLVVLKGDVYAGNQTLLWTGVAIVIVAIILNGMAYGKLAGAEKKTPMKGILLAIISGIGLTFFYGLVLRSLSPEFVDGGSGTFAPQTGVFFFAVGVLLTTPIFNGIAMKHPVQGAPVTMKDYFSGSARTHLIGMLGGLIWMSGMCVSFLGAGSGLVPGAVAYALSNAAPIVAMIWGFFIWKEFKNAPKGTNALVAAMFILFVLGLVIITLSNN